jgi:hypothetical protein
VPPTKWRKLSASLTPRGGESSNGKLDLEAFIENKGVLRHVSGELAGSRLLSTPTNPPQPNKPNFAQPQYH